jgi:hypothetical protein
VGLVGANLAEFPLELRGRKSSTHRCGTITKPKLNFFENCHSDTLDCFISKAITESRFRVPSFFSSFVGVSRSGTEEGALPSFEVHFAWRISFVHLAAWPRELVDTEAV